MMKTFLEAGERGLDLGHERFEAAWGPQSLHGLASPALIERRETGFLWRPRWPLVDLNFPSGHDRSCDIANLI